LAVRWLRPNAAAAATVVAVGVAWGLLTGLFTYVADHETKADVESVRLLAQADAPFNPTGWAFRLGWNPAARLGVVGGCAIVWLTAAWLLRAGTRPRTTAAALGSAAAAGLVAAWVSALFLAPGLAAGLKFQLYPLRADESLTWRTDADGRNGRLTQPDVDTPHLDVKSLERFVPPEKRDLRDARNAAEYVRVHRDLVEVNRQHSATIGVWVAQFSTLLYFQLAALAGAWAADHLARSGRGPRAKAWCFAELYLSTLWVVVVGTMFAVFAVIAIRDDPSFDRPPVWPFGLALAASVLITALAYAGVVRRWHWAVRLGGYVLIAGGAFGIIVAAFGPPEL
jgi:hypothetical protein